MVSRPARRPRNLRRENANAAIAASITVKNAVARQITSEFLNHVQKSVSSKSVR